ncbi:MAG: PaaI family thioesterase [Pseudomonadota bacterium]
MTNDLASTMPLATLLGIQITQADKARVKGSMTVREDMCTLGGNLHGGAIMALADSLGAVAAFLNLPDGAAGTTTIESKTNFLRAAPAGTTVQGETVPLNAGKRLAVLTTTIKGEDGKDVAVVTQTQLVL